LLTFSLEDDHSSPALERPGFSGHVNKLEHTDAAKRLAALDYLDLELVYYEEEEEN
jgi:hypothetical protein